LQPFFTNKYWSKSDHVHDLTIEMPPPPDEDHLERTGGERKRRHALDQREVMRVEEPEHGIPRPLLLDVDNNSKTYGQFIDQYIAKWRPYEVNHGSAWRVDKPVMGRLPDSSQKGHSPNARNAWFNVRKPMYEFFELKMSEESLEETIRQGQVIYESAKDPNKTQDRPTLKAVKNKFVGALQSLGARAVSGGGRQKTFIRDDVTAKLENMHACINQSTSHSSTLAANNGQCSLTLPSPEQTEPLNAFDLAFS
jgi:hypothetical protein